MTIKLTAIATDGVYQKNITSIKDAYSIGSVFAGNQGKVLSSTEEEVVVLVEKTVWEFSNDIEVALSDAPATPYAAGYEKGYNLLALPVNVSFDEKEGYKAGLERAAKEGKDLSTLNTVNEPTPVSE